MNILVACEESQTVASAFRERGHNAFSCDLKECSGGHPEYHIIADVIPLLNGGCTFYTSDGDLHCISGKWDLIIAHPPCTYLTRAGVRWFNVEKYGINAVQRYSERAVALDFFMQFVHCNCDHVCIENPVGYVSTAYRKPDQIIHPYMFCSSETDPDYQLKETCLWLRGLPLLSRSSYLPKPCYDKYFSNANGIYKSKSWVLMNRSAVIRSKTFSSVAAAMAHQWNDLDSFIDWDNRQIKFDLP